MNKKVEFIDKSKITECWGCEGTGKKETKTCELCKGTGKWKEDNYILVAETLSGKKIAFQVDGIK